MFLRRVFKDFLVAFSLAFIDWLIMVGWVYVSELRPSTGILFIPRVICEHGHPWRWCRLEITPDWPISLAVLPAETSGASRRNWRRSENFAYQYLKYLKGSLTCRKILRHGTSGFTSHPKEGVLRIFIALKNPSPLPGLNPRPLGPVASTLSEICEKKEGRKLLKFTCCCDA